MRQSKLLTSLYTGGDYEDYVPTSVRDALQGVSLAACKNGNKDVYALCMIKLIKDLFDHFNSAISENGIVRLVKKVTKRYYFLKIDEIALLFDKAKDGDFSIKKQLEGWYFDGNVYGRLDPTTVLKWVRYYDCCLRNEMFVKDTTDDRYFDRLDYDTKRRDDENVKRELKFLETKYKAKKIHEINKQITQAGRGG